MMISIRGNWSKAESEHEKYVAQQIKDFTSYYTLRPLADVHLVPLLSGLVKKIPQAEMQPALDALLASMKLLQTLPNAQRPAMRRYLEGAAVLPASLAGTKTVNNFITQSGAALAHVNLAWTRLSAGCRTSHDVSRVAAVLQREILTAKGTGRKQNIVTSRIRPYVAAHAARKKVDPQSVAFLLELNPKIGTAAYTDLQASIPVFQRHLNACGTNFLKAFTDNIARVFDYEKFCNASGWGAYALCAQSPVQTCPYCNQAYAFTITRLGKKRGFRPTLDHFLPQHKFPHLALSLGNLVPSCYVCNANLKGKTDFDAKEHLHPLYDDEAFTFRLDVDGDTSINAVNNIKKLRSMGKLAVSYDRNDERACRTAETFMLEQRYKHHRDEAIAFAEMVMSLDKPRLQTVSAALGGKSMAQLLRFDGKHYANTMMGKMYLDIFEHLKR